MAAKEIRVILRFNKTSKFVHASSLEQLAERARTLFKIDQQSPVYFFSKKVGIEQWDDVHEEDLITVSTDKTLKKAHRETKKKLSLYSWITNKDSEVSHLLRTSRTPKQLARNEAEFKAVFRDDQLAELFKLLSNRLEQFDPLKAPSHRWVNAIIAMHAPPGGGKSFFLDEIAQVCTDEAALSQKCPDKNLVEILNNAVMVPISFNGHTPYIRTSIFEKSINMALASRALASYFAAPMMESTFMDSVATKFPTLSLREAVSCIIEAIQQETNKSTASVFLLVDEIIKLGTLENITDALSIIGSQLDRGPHIFSALITTLNMTPLTASGSGRIIKWIRLPPLPLPQAVSLFQKGSANLPMFVLQAISDCNGHPRSLEALGQLLNQHRNDWTKLNHEIIMQQLLENPMLNMYTTIPHDLVKLALLGKPVPLTMPVAGFTINHYIEQGYLNNPLTGSQASVVPEITPLYLTLYAKSHFSSPLPEGNLAVMLRYMLMLEPTFDGPRFEEFHAYWEAVIRHCIVHSTGSAESIQTTLHDFYQIEKPKHSPTFTITAKPKRVIQVRKNFPTDSIDPPLTANEHLLSEDDLQNGVILVGNQNPGYDILVVEPSSNGPLAIAIECKYSETDSTTVLGESEVKHKHSLLFQNWQPHLQGGNHYQKSFLGKLGLDKSRLWFVVCPWRPMSATASQFESQQVLLLKPAQLEKLYSPSLASRPHFKSVIQHSKELREKAGLQQQSLSYIIANQLPKSAKRPFGTLVRFATVRGFRR